MHANNNGSNFRESIVEWNLTELLSKQYIPLIMQRQTQKPFFGVSSHLLVYKTYDRAELILVTGGHASTAARIESMQQKKLTVL